MKKAIPYVALGLIVFLAGLMAAIRPSIASGHSGNASVSCTSVTFSYADFPNAQNTVNETVSVDGATVYSASFSFTGTGGSHSVSISVPQDGADHTVAASANWNTNGAQGSFSESAKVNCGTPPETQPPAPRCPPGEFPTDGKDGEPGNEECEPPPSQTPPTTTPTIPAATTSVPTAPAPTTPSPTVPSPTVPTTTSEEPPAPSAPDKPSKPNKPSKPEKPQVPGAVPLSPVGSDAPTLPFTS